MLLCWHLFMDLLVVRFDWKECVDGLCDDLRTFWLLADVCVCVVCCLLQVDTLYAGEVGYLAAQIKSVQDARVGDTITQKKLPASEALAGYEDVQPMVYCGLFPTDADDYQVCCCCQLHSLIASVGVHCIVHLLSEPCGHLVAQL